jgi:NADP-dependent 3-hydroxy acid dehydrogenase YdfG
MTTVGIVTGAGRGMGAACAARLVDMVDVMVLVDRDEGSVAEAADRLTGDGPQADVEPMGLDVTGSELASARSRPASSTRR